MNLADSALTQDAGGMGSSLHSFHRAGLVPVAAKAVPSFTDLPGLPRQTCPTCCTLQFHPRRVCLQVVVDTAEAGKALLARGRLRNRVTLIPLDKVLPALMAAMLHIVTRQQ